MVGISPRVPMARKVFTACPHAAGFHLLHEGTSPGSNDLRLLIKRPCTDHRVCGLLSTSRTGAKLRLMPSDESSRAIAAPTSPEWSAQSRA
jgi:hypothetical protein